MFWTYVFILSGVALVTLTIAKRFEMKGRELSLLRAVSKGDVVAREMYHRTLHFYGEGKHKFVFFIKKQLPLKVKIHITRAIVWVREKGEARFGNMRNTRLLKRPDGMKEFFKSMAEVEKGAGELHDDVYIEVEETIPTPAAIRITRTEPEKKPVTKPRKPRAKKIKVIEVGE